jgi:hypothetical protein
LSGRNISVVIAYFFAKPKISLSTSLVFDESEAATEVTADSDVDGVVDADCDTDDTLDDNA